MVIVTLSLSKLSADMLSVFLIEKASYIWTFIIVVILSSLNIFCFHTSPIIVFTRPTLTKSCIIVVLLLILFNYSIMLQVLYPLTLAVQDLLAPSRSRRKTWIRLIRTCCLHDRRFLTLIFHMSQVLQHAWTPRNFCLNLLPICSLPPIFWILSAKHFEFHFHVVLFLHLREVGHKEASIMLITALSLMALFRMNGVIAALFRDFVSGSSYEIEFGLLISRFSSHTSKYLVGWSGWNTESIEYIDTACVVVRL